MFANAGHNLLTKSAPSHRLLHTIASPRIAIGRHVAFALAVGGGCTATAIYLTESDTAKRRTELGQQWWPVQRQEGSGLVAAYARLRHQEASDRVRTIVEACGDSVGRLPQVLGTNWLSLPEAKRSMTGILGICGVIFVVWNVPSAQRFAQRWLWHDPLSARASTLLFSTFAHKSLPHFAFNSIALWSIGSAAYSYMDRYDKLPRSTSRYEFFALFVTAGLASALVSHVHAARILAPRLANQSPASSVRSAILPSLGSSGAIYSCLIISGLAYPEAQVSLIFIPFVPLPIGGACLAMVCVDAVGLWRGWRLFDHAAHLGGALYGALYFYLGHSLFDSARQRFFRRRLRETAG